MAILKTKDVAARLALTPARVNQLCAEGKLPGYRTHPTGHWRFNSEELVIKPEPPEVSLPEQPALVEPDTSIFDKIKNQVRNG